MKNKITLPIFFSNRLPQPTPTPLNLAKKTTKETLSAVIVGLINENVGDTVTISNTHIHADIPDMSDPTKTHCVDAEGSKNPISTEIILSPFTSLKIDQRDIKTLDDLRIIGLGPKQLQLVHAHNKISIFLEELYENAKATPPNILKSNAYKNQASIKAFLENRNKANLLNIIKNLPAKEIFVLSDTTGNVDGSVGNPIKNLMIGALNGVSEYHPILSAFKHQYKKLYLIQSDKNAIEFYGNLPKRLDWIKHSWIDNGITPVNGYSLSLMNHKGSQQKISAILPSYTLMSKRSSIPVHHDFQIKTSFPAQFTTQFRSMKFDGGKRAVDNTKILYAFAEQNKLPKNTWILPELATGHVKGKEDTAFYIRGGIQDAFSNARQPIPTHLKPLTAASLWSRNILLPETSLFEALGNTPEEAKALFKSIANQLFSFYSGMLSIGAIPESHSQNLIYLINPNTKQCEGVLLRDIGGVEFDPAIVRSHSININATVSSAYLPLEPSEIERFKTRYFHYSIFQKHLEPLGNLLIEKYHIEPNEVIKQTHEAYRRYFKPKNHTPDNTNGLFAKNLATIILKDVQDSEAYTTTTRTIKNYPLLPK